MLGPDSRLLTALLILGSIALLVGAIRFRLLAVKILCGTMSIAVAMVGGIAVVNFYYGYYTTWGQLWADFHGANTGNLGTISAASTQTAVGSGQIGWIDLPGKLSGYDRKGLLYLPPQYYEAKYKNVPFPVVELFHGSPGKPGTWITELHIADVMNSLLAKHEIGPMVLVMPSINSGTRDGQECVNTSSVNDETYVTKDVRADVLARYRVSHDPTEWAVGGYSSGGYCAANLAMRHPASYGAAVVINGYFRAVDGPAYKLMNHSQPLENANSPLYLAENLPPNSSGPLPAFWVAAGTHDKVDYPPATRFVAALDRFQEVPFIKFSAGDTANAWTAALPHAMTWLWQQVAPPDLRVLFPVRTSTTSDINNNTLYVPPLKRHQPTPCLPTTPANSAKSACGNQLPGLGNKQHAQVQTAAGTFKGSAA
jgi:pimeloyl-ACP methyl ester carboxylesterase